MKENIERELLDVRVIECLNGQKCKCLLKCPLSSFVNTVCLSECNKLGENRLCINILDPCVRF